MQATTRVCIRLPSMSLSAHRARVRFRVAAAVESKVQPIEGRHVRQENVHALRNRRPHALQLRAPAAEPLVGDTVDVTTPT